MFDDVRMFFMMDETCVRINLPWVTVQFEEKLFDCLL